MTIATHNLGLPENSEIPTGPGSDRHSPPPECACTPPLPWRVVFCTNFLPPYRLTVLKMLTQAFRGFSVLVSTDMEQDRPWQPDWRGLMVTRQRSLSARSVTEHPSGFDQKQTVHIPYDTIFLLRKFRPDVVISGELGVRSVLAALYCAAVRSCRLIIWADVSEATEAGRGPIRRLLRRWLIERASSILVNGTSGRRYIEAMGGASNRIHTVPYTTDIDPFLWQPLERGPCLRRKLLYVGRLIKPKGLLPLLEVCARWCAEHPSRILEILFVGDGELQSALRSFRAPANLDIQLEHSAPYAEMPAIYQRGGILVLPTLSDTWGLVVNEAMAAGLPVLGSFYSQAVDELVTDGENGWKFRSDDPEDTYRALCRAMDCSDDELAAMGARARERSAAIRPELVASLISKAVENVCRPRGAILTNMIAPYRIPLYSAIGRAFDLTILTSKHEADRTHWRRAESPGPFSLRESSGFLLTYRQKVQGQTFGYTYLQLPIGVLFDLIHLHPDWIISTEMGFRTLMAWLYSSFKNVPLWVWWGGTLRTESRIGFLRRVLRHFLVKRVKNWISYGVSSTEYLTSIGVNPSRILTIQNCAAPSPIPDQQPRVPSSSEKPHFLCVGRLIGLKGVDALLRGLTTLQAEGLRCKLTLLGSGPEQSNLQRLASELGLDDVHFAGECCPNDVSRIYTMADCVVFPTMKDVWGLVVNEAILAGTPVLCSIYAGCVNELVPVEYRFDPCDPESVKRALRMALRGEVKPIPRSVLRAPESVAQCIIDSINSELIKSTKGAVEAIVAAQ